MDYVGLLSASEKRKRKEALLERFEAADKAELEAIQEKCKTENRKQEKKRKMVTEPAEEVEKEKTKREKEIKENAEFNSNLLNTLLTECFMNLFNRSIDYSEDQYDPNIARSFISNYIKNEGNSVVLNRMKTGSALLSEMAFLIEGTCKSKKCKDDDEDGIDRDKFEKKYRVAPEVKDEFFSKLDNVIDSEDVTQSIQLRVSNAMSEFINNTAEKKRQIDDTVETIKEKINADTSDELKEAYQINANRRIDQINNTGYVNLFEKLVTNLSESVYRNDELKMKFCEDGKLNMDKVIQHVKSLYSVLEIFNTTKLETFNAEKIEEIVKSYDLK